jgi:PAS domain S-box-containing protein
MGLQTASRSDSLVIDAEAKALKAGQLNIGPRLMLGFAVIIFSMLAADAVVLWQFHLVRAEAERLNGVDQKLVAVLRLHTSLTRFHDRLEDLANSQDIGGLVTEGELLRAAVLEDSRRAMSAFSVAPVDFQQDPTILPILRSVQSALPAQLEVATTLATSGDWRAVQLRLSNQVRSLELLTSELVEKVDHAAGDRQAQAVKNINRVERLVFVALPVTAILTLLIAAGLALAVTRSITQPLAQLVEGSRALARGEFQHQLSVSGKDELAELGQVFNETAQRLHDLYATLQTSEDSLRLVIDTVPTFAWTALPDGSADFVNSHWQEYTGLSIEKTVGSGWEATVHPQDLNRHAEKWRMSLATGEPFENEVRYRRAADGQYRWFLARAVPLRDQRGKILKWYGISTDIEDRKRAELELKQAYLHFSEAQRLSKTGSFISDLLVDEHIWSEELRRICEFDPKAKITVQMVRDIIHPEDVPLYEAAVARGMTGENVDFVFRIVTSRGVIKHLHGIARATELVEGRPLFSGAIQDVTEIKEAEEALNTFTASIAHEVNQPLSGIITNASTCRRMLDGEPPNIEGARETARRIIRDGNRASDVITRLRALFSKKELTPEPLNFNEATLEVIALSLSDLQRNRVILRSELADDLPIVTGDRVQLQQVILNLLRNASDAMSTVQDRPRELLIRTQRDDGDRVRLTVKDVGIGFQTAGPDKLFEAFYTTKNDGMGIGLSVSRSIIERHNGRLWAEPNEGPGVTFSFSIPRRSGDTQARVNRTDAPPGAAGYKALPH